MTPSRHGLPLRNGARLGLLIDAALEAGAAILQAFGGLQPHDLKSDASPVTESDRRAERIILRHLRAGFPGVPVVAEEAMDLGDVPPHLGGRFFLVDPLDGSREFIAGLPDFTVNIALVEAGRPALGVVFAPAGGEVFAGAPDGAFKACMGTGGNPAPFAPIATRPRPARPAAVVSRSRPRTEADLYLRRYGAGTVTPLGSSLKFCRVAEGAADLYPCLGPTKEWDTAAGQAVLEAAGGRVLQLGGAALDYAKRGRAGLPDFLNPPFVAVGRGHLLPDA